MRTPAATTGNVPRIWAPASPAAMRAAVVVVTGLLSVSATVAVLRLGRRSALTVGSAPSEAVIAGVLAMSAISLVALASWVRGPRSRRTGGSPSLVQVVMAVAVPLVGGPAMGLAVSAAASAVSPTVLLWQPRRLDVFLISLFVSAWAWPKFLGVKLVTAAGFESHG